MVKFFLYIVYLLCLPVLPVVLPCQTGASAKQNSGDLILKSGDSYTQSGSVSLKGGDSAKVGGSVAIGGGDGSDIAGSVVVNAGTASASGTPGDIEMYAGSSINKQGGSFAVQVHIIITRNYLPTTLILPFVSPLILPLILPRNHHRLARASLVWEVI